MTLDWIATDQIIGRTGTYHDTTHNMTFHVRILNARQRYGNIDYQIEPLRGTGSYWTTKVDVHDDARMLKEGYSRTR